LTQFTLNVPDEVVKAIAREVADQVGDHDRGDRNQDRDLPDDARLAYSQTEAAEALGISVDHLVRHVLPEVRFVRSGRLRLIPRDELVEWLKRNGARLGDR
jgi:excisionase family DNA binding protein